MLSLILALSQILAHATSVDVASTEMAELRRMNSPFGPPPIALLVRESAPTRPPDLQQALWRSRDSLPTPAFGIFLTPGYGIWEIFGVPAGYVGSGDPTPLHKFLETERDGVVFVLGLIDHAHRSDLVDGLMNAVRSGSLTTSTGATVKMRNNALVLEVQDTDEVAPGLTVAQLHLRADRSTRHDGFRLDLFTGFHIRALLGSCGPSLVNPQTTP